MSEIYHALSRGVDKRKIFMDDKDRFRFIHDLFEFNDEAPADHTSYHCANPAVIARRQIHRKPRKLLVDIFAFCLMPNHYHLLLAPRAEGNISRFMKKLNMGYSRYFNERHERKGTLFEGRYKSILIENQAHFIHLPYYIHLNPLDLITPEWRKRKLTDYKRAIRFLDTYRWSSHLDYIGQKNFPSVTQRDFFLEIFSGEGRYEKQIKSWLGDLEVKKIGGFVLE